MRGTVIEPEPLQVIFEVIKDAATGMRGMHQCRQDLLQRAVQLARQAGAQVALDMASFEVVREFRADVEALIESKQIDCCFCNEVILPCQLHAPEAEMW